MMKQIGRYSWAIAEGYIPPASTGKSRELTSHETVCILNASDVDARVEITVYFADPAPVGPYVFDVGAKRTRHLRFNEFKDPEPIRSIPIFQRHRRQRAGRRAAHAARQPASRTSAAQHHGISARHITPVRRRAMRTPAEARIMKEP